MLSFLSLKDLLKQLKPRLAKSHRTNALPVMMQDDKSKEMTHALKRNLRIWFQHVPTLVRSTGTVSLNQWTNQSPKYRWHQNLDLRSTCLRVRTTGHKRLHRPWDPWAFASSWMLLVRWQNALGGTADASWCLVQSRSHFHHIIYFIQFLCFASVSPLWSIFVSQISQPSYAAMGWPLATSLSG